MSPANRSFHILRVAQRSRMVRKDSQVRVLLPGFIETASNRPFQGLIPYLRASFAAPVYGVVERGGGIL